ncbi:MAG TPA: hypothetical protein VLG38_07375 [Gammaproteobacteria bacterium]|nr:hypothetical protein [Gammaproteobacteria bacterium]
MIHNLDLSLFYDESFVEFNVKDTELNLSQKSITIVTRGAWLDREEHNVLREAKIFIQQWDALSVCVMNKDTNSFSAVNMPEEYILRDIIKFHYEHPILRLTGFGINGEWVQWEFINPQVKIHGDIE